MKPLYISKLLPIILIVFSTIANANDYVYLGAWSYHFNDNPNTHREASCTIEGCRFYLAADKYNESHRLIGYQKNSYLLAHYDNSFYQSTWLASRQFESAFSKNFSALAAIGITYGYTDCDYEDKGTNPTACPYYQVGIAYTKFKLQPIIATSGSVLTISFRLEI